MLKEQVLKTLPVPNHQRHFANFIIINAIEYEAHETSSKTHPCKPIHNVLKGCGPCRGSTKVKLLAERGSQNGDESLYSCKWLWVTYIV
jgi:hypothetical protein